MDSLFIALPINQTIGTQVGRLCYGLPHVSWTEHNNFYLILSHLGQADGALQLDIQEALRKIRFSPFDLSLQGVSYFPSKKAKGIIWLGITPSDVLTLFYQSLHRQLSEISNKFDLKTFPPYIPLGHFEKIDERRLMDYLDANSGFSTHAFKNDSFLLLKNRQQTTVFNEVARFKLSV